MIEEIFHSQKKDDIASQLADWGVIAPSCPLRFWLIVHFVILNLPTSTAAHRLGARRYIYSQGGQVLNNALYHSELFDPPFTLKNGLNLGR